MLIAVQRVVCLVVNICATDTEQQDLHQQKLLVLFLVPGCASVSKCQYFCIVPAALFKRKTIELCYLVSRTEVSV